MNGFVLHWFSFPVVIGNGALTYGRTLLLAITGSLSTSHWLLTAFIGASKPLRQLPLKALLCTYAFVCAITILVGILCMSAIRQRLLLWRETSTGKRLAVPVLLQEAAYTLMQLRDNSNVAPMNYIGTVDIKL
jgi:hypothetical protein